MSSDLHHVLAMICGLAIRFSAAFAVAHGDTRKPGIAGLAPIAFAGMGKLRIGMTLNQIERAAGRPLTSLNPMAPLNSPDCHYVAPKS